MKFSVKNELPFEAIKGESKNIRIFSNGIWKWQPHLLFFFGLCRKSQVWFQLHLHKLKKGEIIKVGGFHFKLETGK